MKEYKECIICMRNFLLKWFIIGFAIFLLSSILFIFLKDFGGQMAMSLYGIDPDFYINFAFIMLGLIKLFLIFMVLAPALALHWMIRNKNEV